MLEHARLPHPLGHWTGRDAGTRRQGCVFHRPVAHVYLGDDRLLRELVFFRNGNQRHGAEIILRVLFQFLTRFVRGLWHAQRANALDIRDGELLAHSVIRDRAGEPAGGYETLELRCAGLEFDHGNRVVGAVCDKEPVTVFLECERIGLRSEKVGRRRASPDFLDDLAALRRDDTQCVVSRIAHDDMPAIRRKRHGARVPAGEKFRGHLPARQIDNRHTAFARNVPLRVHAHKGSAACGADEILRAGTTSAPIGYIRFPAMQNHVVRCHTDIDGAQHFVRGEVDFGELVAKIQADVEQFAVRRDRHARRDVVLALGRARLGQRDTAIRLYDSGHCDIEHLHGAVHVAEENVRAIRRENDAGEAKLPAFI